MTTTAEKIKVMQAFVDGHAIQRGMRHNERQCKPEEWQDDGMPTWDWMYCDYRIKTPNPEPLECWANHYGAGPSGPDIVAFNSKELAVWHAETVANQNSNTLLRAVKMRQVTPQDEQDRKDAARYRWFKSKARSFEKNPPLFWQPIEKWDEEIDKAIQGDNDDSIS